MKRKGLILGVVLGALVLSASILALLFIDPIVRTSTVKISSNALQVPTKLRSADLMLKGQLTLEQFEVPNPAGFSEPVAFRFDRFDAAMPWSSAFSDEIVISHLEIENLDLTIEFDGAKSNLSVLLDHLKADQPSEPSSSSKRFRIARFEMIGAKVHFKSDLLTGGPRSFVLPPIELTDVGKSNWATVEEIIAIVLRTLAAKALQQGGTFLPDSLKRGLQIDMNKFPIGEIQKQLERSIPDFPGRIKRPE